MEKKSYEFDFGLLKFSIKENKIRLISMNGGAEGEFCIAEVQLVGENKDTHRGVKMCGSSEGERLIYIDHEQTENFLKIIQRSDLIETKTVFERYDDTNAIRVYTEVKNIAKEKIVLEEISSFVGGIFEKNTMENAQKLYFHKFTQGHHVECQPRSISFYDYGLDNTGVEGQKRIAFANIGSWSTKEELPQGIIENRQDKKFLMFQIESSSSWYYEISDKWGEYYLYLSGGNLPFGNWSKALSPGESYRTINSALAFGNSIDAVVGEMTKYRRHISKKNIQDSKLPTIFNEYMHFSWDNPSEETTKKMAAIVARTGVDYYVIDCGWHNEEPANEIYAYVGQWKESKTRFPGGIRATTDYIRSLGMKAGLWIEPEVIGIKCQEMLSYYDDDCFLQRYGKRLSIMGRYFLDFRSKKVVDYMTETIRRMVEDYGADYIKFDYNQDCGVGTDYLALCAGEGLEKCTTAFLSWVKNIQERFPNVLFEGCASGGMRMDYRTLSEFSIISTSDQIDYLKYPYIAGNILSAVLPEQAGVWSYPVVANLEMNNLSDERIYINMVNSFLGRLHLASHLENLSERQFLLVKEGIEIHKKIAETKKNSVPFFPLGFNELKKTFVVAGFKSEDEAYLAVWNLGGDMSNSIKLPGYKNVECLYPSNNKLAINYKDDILMIEFTEKYQARFLRLKQ